MKKTLLLFILSIGLFAAQAQTVLSINYQNTPRSFILHLPAGYTAGQHLPLVINHHGYTSNASQEMLYTQMNTTADNNHFIVVYPDGLNNAWNSGFVGSYSNPNPDDVGFIGKIIDTMNLLYGVDLNRVYSCGMSNGGYQSYRLACDLENRIAAIASVTGSLTNNVAINCNQTRSVPILEIHGTADPTVPYNGATGSYAIEDVISFWVSKNQCSTVSDTTFVANTNTADSSTVQEIRYRSCAGGSEVWLYKVIGGEHTWPGALIDIGVTNKDINASQEIWDFFNRYTLSSGTVGINEVQNTQPQVKIFPNPVNDVLQIEATQNLQQVSVYNVLGERVLFTQPQLNKASISTATLLSGIYIVKAEGKGFTETRRIVKE